MSTVKKMLVVLFTMAVVTFGGNLAGAQMHHVVGGDRGWSPSSDMASWCSGRNFRVGDKIWFSYSAAEESVAEVGSMEEYVSCNVSNPIRMYTEGINSISLDKEGMRYFTSGKPESCKNGLKLPVKVLSRDSPQNPMATTLEGSTSALATAPTTPSGSTHLCGSLLLLLFGIGLCYLSIYI
ncbi:hypothetical protein SLE2022_321200 [Rubroshorea leprosula]